MEKKHMLYTTTPVEKELPEINTRHFVVTINKHGVISDRRYTYIGGNNNGGWITDAIDEQVTHWLKPLEITDAKIDILFRRNCDSEYRALSLEAFKRTLKQLLENR